MSRKRPLQSTDPAAKAHDPSPVWRAAQQLAAKSHATPIEGSVRAQMETRFGAQFSTVRIHADATAAESARTFAAAAYTVGSDIVFGAGRYQPHSGAGQRLLAHELAHVVQQSRGGSASSDAEARADREADQATQGGLVSTQTLGGAPVALQAEPDDNPAAHAGLPFPTKTLSGFALNSAALTPAHTADIDSLAWSISLHLGMRKNGRATISIVGHTDRSGDEKLNEALGQSRADTARQALIDALKKQGVGADKFGEIGTSSMGESSPIVPTADGVKNEKNRRVEISVSIGSQPVAPSAKPTFDPFAPLKPSVIPDQPGIGPRRDPDGGDLWRRMQENQKKIEEFDRKHPAVKKSLSEAVIDKVMEELVDPLIKKLPVPKDLKDFARSGVRKGLEKGSEAACDAAVDGTGASGEEAEALKAACRAALKTKPGGASP
jgi:outer membrane protein OmpA-like peptidoglycan-associated protein